MKGNVRFEEHQIISELRMRKEYRMRTWSREFLVIIDGR